MPKGYALNMTDFEGVTISSSLIFSGRDEEGELLTVDCEGGIWLREGVSPEQAAEWFCTQVHWHGPLNEEKDLFRFEWNGEMRVRVDPDRQLTFGPSYKPSAEARAFWETFAREFIKESYG
jgi:hypothetical protein